MRARACVEVACAAMKMCDGPAFGCKQRANCDVALPPRRNCDVCSPDAVSRWQQQSAAFYESYLLNSLYFQSFAFFSNLFIYLFGCFGASSRSRTVKYSCPCCVLKIRLISTPSLFSSSASPLSLPDDDDELQKHVYLARLAFFPAAVPRVNGKTFPRLSGIGTLALPAGA